MAITSSISSNDPDISALVASESASDPVSCTSESTQSLLIELIVQDPDGVEHLCNLVDFLPYMLNPEQLLDMGREFFSLRDSDKACICLEQLINDFPTCFQRPEAIYLLGMIRFLKERDVSHLIGIHTRLSAEYPQSEWLEKASVYELLKQ